jgi:Domain of unknown function (DUF4349)
MQRLWQKKKQSILWLSSLIFIVLLFAGCGDNTTNSSAVPSAPGGVRSSSPSSGTSKPANGATGSNSGNQKTSASDVGPQYLVKTLNVDMEVKDTRKVADSLQTWITTTDPRATSSATDYEEVGDNLYDISLTFSVQASIYSQVYQYLRDYTVHNGGHLAKFNESVQDVANTYVDTQSRLQNLRVEQGRLQDLLSRAQDMNDILTIEQKLSDIEGQIESDEAQLNTLNSQVTFYTVSMTLEPIDIAQSGNAWSIGQIFYDAFAASLAFGENIISFIVWLLAFSLYVVPIAVIAWFVRRWYRRSRRVARPKVAMMDLDTGGE